MKKLIKLAIAVVAMVIAALLTIVVFCVCIGPIIIFVAASVFKGDDGGEEIDMAWTAFSYITVPLDYVLTKLQKEQQFHH